MITIRRACACGDVIQAIPIAKALMKMGHEVTFQSVPKLRPIVERFEVPYREYVEGSPVDVELDNTYEQYRDRLNSVSVRKWFFQFSVPQLITLGIDLRWEDIYPPVMPKRDSVRMGNLLVPYEKPWIMVCPRSATPVNDVPRNSEIYQCPTRCVPDETWAVMASRVKGTCFWLGIHGEAPKGIKDLNVRDMNEVTMWMDHADLMVTVDTGPMHIALAMGIPTIAVYQSIDPRMTFEGAQNLTIVSPDLDCLGCCKLECPINAQEPPCQFISANTIINAVNGIKYVR